MQRLRKENGIALILALLILLILSILSVTIAFISGMEFKLMVNYREGEEAFLAAERCTGEVRRAFEVIGANTILFFGGNPPGIDREFRLPNNSICRSGERGFNRTKGDDEPPPLVDLSKMGVGKSRPIKHTSIPSSGSTSGGYVLPVETVVTGKSSTDRDLYDTDPIVNSGTEIVIGIESFVLGGTPNMSTY